MREVNFFFSFSPFSFNFFPSFLILIDKYILIFYTYIILLLIQIVISFDFYHYLWAGHLIWTIFFIYIIISKLTNRQRKSYFLNKKINHKVIISLWLTKNKSFFFLYYLSINSFIVIHMITINCNVVRNESFNDSDKCLIHDLIDLID